MRAADARVASFRDRFLSTLAPGTKQLVHQMSSASNSVLAVIVGRINDAWETINTGFASAVHSLLKSGIPNPNAMNDGSPQAIDDSIAAIERAEAVSAIPCRLKFEGLRLSKAAEPVESSIMDDRHKHLTMIRLGLADLAGGMRVFDPTSPSVQALATFLSSFDRQLAEPLFGEEALSETSWTSRFSIACRST